MIKESVFLCFRSTNNYSVTWKLQEILYQDSYPDRSSVCKLILKNQSMRWTSYFSQQQAIETVGTWSRWPCSFCWTPGCEWKILILACKSPINLSSGRRWILDWSKPINWAATPLNPQHCRPWFIMIISIHFLSRPRVRIETKRAEIY